MRNMRVRFSGETNIGMKRKHNEDSFLIPDYERVAVVADGMGGHASGEVASGMAVASVGEYLQATLEQPIVTWPFKLDTGVRYDTNRLVIAIKHANQRIYETAQRDEEKHGMGTTIVAALFNDDRVIVAHVGDSRCYRLRRNQLIQLTEDHSLLNDYMRMKRLSGEDTGRFTQKNVIVRALGMKESVQVDTMIDQPQIEDIYLLCSDGLSGMVTDPQIAEIMRSESDLDNACDRLIRAANDAGGTDNITAILCRIERL
jgi:serine/threonine protein phosphatase PrpC